MPTPARRTPKSRSEPTPMCRLRIALLDVEPAVWRRVLVPERITLPILHAVIQAAMGWTDSHLHEFLIDGVHYGEPDPEWPEAEPIVDERAVALETALGGGARSFDYVYDFGDDWRHAIAVEERALISPDAAATVICLAGEGACPPDDVGGAPGYAEFLDALADPEHPEHEDFKIWSGGNFDPGRCDIGAINARLKRIKV